MVRLKVKYFGPVKVGFNQADGFFDIPKLTIFIGNQGSGKSTVAKLLSTFMWIEKALVRGDYTAKWFMDNGNFRDTYLAYHRIENYLKKDSELCYQGEAYTIKYVNEKLIIEEISKGGYELPQIMYVPAERNLIATIENAVKLKIISGALIEFLGEYTNALNALTTPLTLPINEARIEYDTSTKTVYVGGNDYRVSLEESASGFQSIVPLFLVSQYLRNSVKERTVAESMSSEEKARFGKMTAEIMTDKNMTDEQKRLAISEIGKKFNKTTFINIIEEPELNLFPAAQEQILWQLLKINNEIEANNLIITTRSPYFINYLTLAVEAYNLKTHPVTMDSGKTKKILDELHSIVPLEAALPATDIALYQLDNGSIQKLEPCEGLPSDQNVLNQSLGSANDSFSHIMELEQCLCM